MPIHIIDEVTCKACGNSWDREEYEAMRPVDASIGYCPSCGDDGECFEMVEVPRDLLEEIRDWLSQPQSTGGNFTMETHRAESEGVEHLLSGIVDALKEA